MNRHTAANSTVLVSTDFAQFANRLAAAVGWAEHFERQGKFSAARDERRLAAHLADAICRTDFRFTTPQEDN